MREEEVKTRSQWYKELDSTTPAGEEDTVVVRTHEDRLAAERELRKLKERRIEVYNELQERKRKLREAKSKYRRTGTETQAELDERQRLISQTIGSAMPCVPVARAADGSTSDQQCEIVCVPAFRGGLDGLEGFGKCWIVCLRKEVTGSDAECGSACVVERDSGTSTAILVLALVDVIAARNGSLVVGGKDVRLLDGASILDIKPYLPYCEAIGDECRS